MGRLKIIGIALIILIPSIFIYLITENYIPAIAMTSAIATVTLTIINYLHLKELRTSRLESLRREIKVVIYSKLYKELEAFLRDESHTREDIETMQLPISWSWAGIKNDQFYLAHQVPKNIFRQLDGFTINFEEYNKCFGYVLRDIKNKIILELQNTYTNIDKSLYLEVNNYFKKGRLPFRMFEAFFLKKNIQESVKQFKSIKEIDSDLVCEFLNGARKTIHLIENEQEVIKFFENLFKDIGENSKNFKELVRLRKTGEETAKQILKQIGPE